MGNGNPASITNQPAPDSQETASNTEKQDDAHAILNDQSTPSHSLKDKISVALPGDADESRGADDATMDSIPLEDCSIKPPTGPTIIQPGGPITEDAPQINAHVATERKPTLSTEFQKSDLDLVSRIPGFFRLLDLYSEMGGNGAVDKIIIEQESMGRAMNTLRAGSYKGVSRINFPALDAVSVRPVGIYGSKSAIVEFLLNLGVVDATLLGQTSKRTKSIHQIPSGPSSLYVIYWPEDETWDDDARTSVKKNRVTFMRFLTKLAPDIRLLLSKNHTSALVWKYDTGEEDHESDEDSACDEESDEDDRFVKLEVTHKRHEEEGVQHYSGFKDLEVRLVPGETSQAFVVLKALEGGLKPKPIEEAFTRSRLQSELRKYKAIILDESFDEPGVQILCEVGALPTDAATLYEKHRRRHMKGEGGFLDIQEKELSVLQSKWPSLRKEVELKVRGRFVEVYGDMVADGDSTEPDSKWTSVPEALNEFNSYTTERVPLKVNSNEYKSLKKHFREVQKLIRESGTLTPDDKRNLLASIATKHAEQTSASPPEKSRWNRVKKAAGSMLSKAESTFSSLRRSFSSSLDRDDLDLLDEMDKFSNNSDYDPAIRAIKESLTTWIEAQIEQAAETLSQSITSQLETATEEQILQDYSTEQFTQCLAEIRKYLAPDPTAYETSRNSSTISISALERRPTVYEEPKFFLHAVVSSLIPPLREHEMMQLEMKADDAQLLDEDPGHIPSLSSSSIRNIRTTPATTSILHMQLLNNGRRLFYALESPTGIDIYLMSTRDTFRIACRQRHIPFKENRKLFFAVDEQTRLVACVYIEEVTD
ncbi:hypothetical protein FRC00_004955 [Tulasnella sp. 408]|nr:hypothetical protein FRC00_004955 [Tulasnella sp. 408]